MYTEDEVKVILSKFADMVDDGYRPYTTDNSIGYTLLENLNINDLLVNDIKEEVKYPFTFFSLDKKIEWVQLCELIEIDYYKKDMVSNDEIFYITLSDCFKYNLL